MTEEWSHSHKHIVANVDVRKAVWQSTIIKLLAIENKHTEGFHMLMTFL